MKYRLVGVAAIVFAILIGVGLWYRLQPPPLTIKYETRLYLNWFLTATFSGDLLAARSFAEKESMSIRLEIGGEGRDPIRLVRQNEFGVASADEVLRAIDRGADVAIIGVLNDEHPAAFAALQESNIREPKDFAGRRVGLLPFGATGLIYQAMMANAKVNRREVQEVVVSPDLRPFISKQVNDVQPIFIYDEPVTLDSLGIKYNVIDPRKFDVRFKGQVYFATKQTAANRELTQRFLRAIVAGWNAAAREPETALAALKELSPTININREREILKRGISFFVSPGRKTLETDLSTWKSMLGTLQEAKVITRSLDLESAFDLRSLRAVHAGEK